jgi:hypothetical protein
MMRKFMMSIVIAIFGIASIAHAADGPGVGKWRWSAAESHYASGAYATEQTMIITRNDRDGIAVSQIVTPPDGKTFSWNIEAPWDNKMRKASTWMSFAFKRISDNQFHDRYVMNQGGMRGEETFTITPTKITIRGHSVDKGKKQPYVEVWNRVE